MGIKATQDVISSLHQHLQLQPVHLCFLIASCHMRRVSGLWTCTHKCLLPMSGGCSKEGVVQCYQKNERPFSKVVYPLPKHQLADINICTDLVNLNNKWRDSLKENIYLGMGIAMGISMVNYVLFRNVKKDKGFQKEK